MNHKSCVEVGNFTSHSQHLLAMDCSEIRVLLSARLDHEASVSEETLAGVHLERCSACRAWWSEAGQVTRRLRVRPAEDIPDLSRQVLARSHPVTVGTRQWVRLSLGIVAAVDFGLAAPSLLLGYGTDSVHDARHLGSFGVAMSIGLMYVASRPTRAFGILPIVAALATTMLLAAAIDIGNGGASFFGEAHHGLEIAAMVLVWMLAGRPVPPTLRPLFRHASHRSLQRV